MYISHRRNSISMEVHVATSDEVFKSAWAVAEREDVNIISETVVAIAILEGDDLISGIFPDEDKEFMLHQLTEDMKAGIRLDVGHDGAVHFTTNIKHLKNFARQYASQMGEHYYDIVHLLLALFSYNNGLRRAARKRGWVFNGVVAALQSRIDVKSGLRRLRYNVTPSLTGNIPRWKKALFPWRKKRIVKDLLSEAGQLSHFGNYVGSEQLCDIVLDLDPGNLRAFGQKVYCLYRKKQFRAAIDLYLLAPEAARTDDLLQNIALCYSRCGDFAAAIGTGNLIKNKSALILNNIGFQWLQFGNYGEAIQYFDKATAEDPELACPYNNKGFALFKCGDAGRGKELILFSLTRNKGNSYAYRNLAIIAVAEQNKQLAKKYIDAALFNDYREMYGNDIDAIIADADRLPG